MTLKMLNERAWYRLLKVLFVTVFITVATVWLLFVASSYPPQYSLAGGRTTLVCTSGNQSAFIFDGIGSLTIEDKWLRKWSGGYETLRLDDGSEVRTTPDSELTTYFNSARTPGSLPVMPDAVWKTLRSICGVSAEDGNKSDFRLKDSRYTRLLTMTEVAQAYQDWSDPNEPTRNAVQKNLADPEFNKLSIPQQRAKLGQIDPGFPALSNEQYQLFRQKMAPFLSNPQPKVNGGNVIVSSAVGNLLQNPNFTKLPFAEQKAALGKSDPEFLSLSDEEYWLFQRKADQHESGDVIAGEMVRQFPNTFQIVHAVPELSTVLIDQRRLSANKKAQPCEPKLLPGFAYHEVSTLTLRLGAAVKESCPPTTGIIHLAHDGGWPTTLRIAGFGIFGIALVFELVRRIFYYVVIGMFRPNRAA